MSFLASPSLKISFFVRSHSACGNGWLYEFENRQTQLINRKRTYSASVVLVVLLICFASQSNSRFVTGVLFTTLETGREKLPQRLLGIGEKWPIADRRVPKNDPKNDYGTNSTPGLFPQIPYTCCFISVVLYKRSAVSG